MSRFPGTDRMQPRGREVAQLAGEAGGGNGRQNSAGGLEGGWEGDKRNLGVKPAAQLRRD